MTDSGLFDVCVIGAGIAGIVCAKELENQGLKVVILDKSRGVGGRVATRRLHNTQVNHGAPYLEVQGKFTQELIIELLEHQIIQPWPGTMYELDSLGELKLLPTAERYIADEGMTAIPKYMAKGLDIRFSCLVTTVKPTLKQTWQVISTDLVIEAKALIIAIPAPQIVGILEASSIPDLPVDYLNQLRAIQFEPDLTVMAGYSNSFSNLTWQTFKVTAKTDLARISLQSSLIEGSLQTVLVLHSTSALAKTYLDTDYSALRRAGESLLQTATELLSIPLSSPNWLEIQRWRYAFPAVPLGTPYLETTCPLPLICCGDWSGNNLLESALYSGNQAAKKLLDKLN